MSRRNVEVATALVLNLMADEAHGLDDLDAAFQTLVRVHVQSVLVVSQHQRIVKLAAVARLSALYPAASKSTPGSDELR